MIRSTLPTTDVPYRWQELGKYLKSPQAQLLEDHLRQNLAADWDEITHLEQNLDDALLVALVGGTGVGKSTLINALAGQTISRSGDRRPTTSRVVLYIHRDTDLPMDVPQVDFAQPFVLHANPRLSKIVILDFPDFDSAETTHAAILSRYLPHLDILLIVVDDVKYADQRLYDVLRSLQQDPENIYVVLNKIDRLRERYGNRSNEVTEEILGDLQLKLQSFAELSLERDHLFAIAARPVHLAREGKNASHEELDSCFERLEDCIESYQEEKHRRLAKELNIQARKQALAEQISARILSPVNQETMASLKLLVDASGSELEESLNVISPAIFSDGERRAARTTWMRQAGQRWGLPVSLFFTLLGELPWNRVRDSDALSNLAARVERHYAGYVEAAKNLSRRFDAELVDIPWRSESTAALAPKIDSQWIPGATKALQQALIPPQGPVNILPRIAAHVLPLLVLSVALFTRAEKVLGSEHTLWERFLSFLGLISPIWILNTILGVVLAYFATAIFVWLREIQRMERALSAGEEVARDHVQEIGTEQVRHIKGRLDELRQEMQWVQQIVTGK